MEQHINVDTYVYIHNHFKNVENCIEKSYFIEFFSFRK